MATAENGRKWLRAYALRVLGTLTVLGAALTCSMTAERQGTVPPLLWGDLQPGRYAVGFRVLYRHDRTRKWRPSKSHLNRAASDKGRPIRLSVWYPAVPAKGAKAMRYGDYFH